MGNAQTQFTSDHKAMLTLEAMHAGVVVLVVLAATIVKLLAHNLITSELLSFVYGGAISYAGGRAASVRGALTRTGDVATNGNGNGAG